MISDTPQETDCFAQNCDILGTRSVVCGGSYTHWNPLLFCLGFVVLAILPEVNIQENYICVTSLKSNIN